MPTLSELLNGDNKKEEQPIPQYDIGKSLRTIDDPTPLVRTGRPSGSGMLSNGIYSGVSSIKKTNSNSMTTIQGIDRMLRMQGIYTDMMYDKYQRFKRFPIFDISEDVLRGCREYIFFTKPELNIYKDSLGTQLNEDFMIQPIFKDIHDRHPRILRQLQMNLSLHDSPFINLLSYTVQNSIDVGDTNSKDIQTAQNMYGSRIIYRGHSFESDQDVSFTLEFKENNIAEIYTFFRVWDIYTNLKSQGIIEPPSKTFAQKRILHDKVAVYKIITTETEDIIYAAKIYGVYPDGAPRGSWSEPSPTDGIVHSVQFKGDFIEDLDPQIFIDFNELVKPYRDKCPYGPSSPWNYEYHKQNNEVQMVPYIYRAPGEDRYKLKWQGGTI